MAFDIHNPEVHHFIEWLEERIEKNRNALERTDKDAVATALIRGRIKEAREVLTHINGDPDENDPDS